MRKHCHGYEINLGWGDLLKHFTHFQPLPRLLVACTVQASGGRRQRVEAGIEAKTSPWYRESPGGGGGGDNLMPTLCQEHMSVVKLQEGASNFNWCCLQTLQGQVLVKPGSPDK